MWPSKCVETEFVINGVRYSIFPPDIGLTYDCWDQGFMELFQGHMSEDLEAIGAVNIRAIGFLD